MDDPLHLLRGKVNTVEDLENFADADGYGAGVEIGKRWFGCHVKRFTRQGKDIKSFYYNVDGRRASRASVAEAMSLEQAK